MPIPSEKPLLVDEIASPIGRIVIAARDGRLCALEFGRARVARQVIARYGRARLLPSRDPFGFSARIRAYLAGDHAAVDDIPVATGGPAFQRSVWRALRRIAPGHTLSYGALARSLGRGAAARAVGAANGRNPVSIVVPCHRLIGVDASLTGYGGGLWRKRWLLRHEGAASVPSTLAAARPTGGQRRGRSRLPR